MSLWVKICGNTTLEDAQMAADAGADAVGFVFAPSPRRVTPEQVAAITPSLPAKVEKVGVFVDEGFAAITAIVEVCGLTGVQLHSAGGYGLSAHLRRRFGTGLRILHVLHFGPGVDQTLAEIKGDANLDGILVDSRTVAAVGGTGIAFDWQAARSSIFRPESGVKMVAAGGLHPGNVAEAIATLEPWGVDVVSGVEAAPGRKDAAKVHAFVAAARAAYR